MIKFITALLPTTFKRVVGSRTSSDLKADLAKLATEAEGIAAHRQSQINAIDEAAVRLAEQRFAHRTEATNTVGLASSISNLIR